MEECITVHVGQAGIQMGNAVWELLCLEHGVKHDGTVHARGSESESRSSLVGSSRISASPSVASTTRSNQRRESKTWLAKRLDMLRDNRSSLTGIRHYVRPRISQNTVADCMGVYHHPLRPEETRTSAFFEELRSGRVTPRAVMIDTEHDVINEILSGIYNQLHQRERMIFTRPDTSGLFSKGYLGHEDLVEEACTQISTMAAKCDNLKSFIVFRSSGGGTGSGLATALMLRLADEYGDKKTILEINTGPTRKAMRMVCKCAPR